MSQHDREFRLPPEVRPLSEARIAVRDHYRRKGLHLEFSFDGNLVGDFGEACAVEEYGMRLVEARSNAGFDGRSPDGTKTIQVKAKGPSTKQIAFTYSETQADLLLVLELDFDGGTGRAIYNGLPPGSPPMLTRCERAMANGWRISSASSRRSAGRSARSATPAPRAASRSAAGRA